MNREPSPLDPRVKRTRKQLQDALRELIQEQPFIEITVQDIADRAAVNRATFYAHYLDKEDLAGFVLAEELKTFMEEQFTPGVAFNRENVTSFAVGVFEFTSELLNVCPEVANEIRVTADRQMQAVLFTLVSDWLKTDKKAIKQFGGASAPAVSSAVSWAIFGAAQDWARAKSDLPAESVAAEVVSVIIRK